MKGASREATERIDTQLAAQSRVEAAVRLHLGQVLEVLSRGACFELGFSSLTAYALERCERGVRWALAARSLARRIETLPELRRAVALGLVSWSKAELVASLAADGDEARWVEAARDLTVRELRALVSNEQRPSAPEAAHEEGDELCTLVCTVDREDAWLFEATQSLLNQLGTRGADAQVEALLAEAQTTLIDGLPRGTIDLEADAPVDRAQAQWEEQLARWRAEAELRCESNIRQTQEEVGRASSTRNCANPRGSAAPNVTELFDPITRAAMLGCAALEHHTAHELDRLAQSLSRALAQHELVLSRLILNFHRSDGWRKLGYATETQYARERLGISRSAFMARRALAVRLETLPHIAEALGSSFRSAHIGVEAALQLVRVATPSTELAWVEHAKRRTIKHLREEVDAAMTAKRISGESDCPPPAVTEIESFQELERAASSGRIWQPSAAMNADPSNSNDQTALGDERAIDATPLGDPASAARRAWRVMLASLTEWLASGVQTSAVQTANHSKQHRSAGRITLRLRVSRATRAWWRGLESQARRWLPRGMNWLRFCCLSVWKAWRHLLAPNIAYGHIYIRDRHRCTSPVCNRRDVTPHHLKFRSQGGSDSDDNVASVCVWCHLLGIHGGRIRAKGTADQIRWELGGRDEPCLVVEGRERRAA